MSDSNCCFLTCIQFSQEAGKVVWYSHLLKNFPQFLVIHTKYGDPAILYADFPPSTFMLYLSDICLMSLFIKTPLDNITFFVLVSFMYFKEIKKEESSRKTFISALLTMPKPLTVWITINCGKFWKRWEYQTTWPASWETYMQVRKQQLELDMEQQTGSK